MSWFPEKRTQDSWVHRFCSSILKCGPIPNHVAFIMDGNRRFAKKNSMESAEGHLKGFDKLAETLEWCLHLGIKEVTVYAFSIENFKRSRDEVDCLMELARQKAKLNVCFSYTSREEICTAMRELAEGVEQGLIRETDVSEELLERCLYTNQSVEPDLLIRTSGEVRLSDFLLWQSTFSVLSFLEVLWPDFSIWHMYAAILHYQRSYAGIQDAKEENHRLKDQLSQESDKESILQETICSCGDKDQSEQCCHSDKCDLDLVSLRDKLNRFVGERKQREEEFIQKLNQKRDAFLENKLPARVK
ncbi:DHDDS-like protein [Mya arenaria]|uniref:Alkyl transferase n=1 Tax=Mya arenaria TaxID=6604 RepID=A0ABY7E9Z2_MYAAR|nr:DHDDS-like protein [Mya arenaria]